MGLAKFSSSFGVVTPIITNSLGLSSGQVGVSHVSIIDSKNLSQRSVFNTEIDVALGKKLTAKAEPPSLYSFHFSGQNHTNW